MSVAKSEQRIELESGIIERMREADEQLDQELFDRGVEAGVSWAKTYTPMRELRNLSHAYEELGDSDTTWMEDLPNARGSASENFYGLIRPGSDRGGELCAFEDIHQFSEEDESLYVHGFARGALDVLAAYEEACKGDGSSDV